MHEVLFCESLRPKQHYCLFVPLRAYALGHEVELWRTENKLCQLSGAEFDKLPAAERKHALIMAVDICSQAWGEYAASEALLSSKPSIFNYRQWRKVRKLNGVWERWRHATDRMTPAEWDLATVDFRIYLNAGRSALPTLYSGNEDHASTYEMLNGGEKLEKGRAPGSPLLAQLIEFAQKRDLRSVFGVESVLDVPFAGCCNLFFGALESEGRLYVMNDKELAQVNELKAIRETQRTENANAQTAWDACTTDDERRDVLKNHPRIFNISPEAVKFANDEAMKQQENQCQP